MLRLHVLVSFGVSVLAMVFMCATSRAEEKKVSLTFSGGHEIGRNDFGRPVTLIAAALDVKPEVFREAFSGVKPAKGRGPTGEEARKNKAALMKALAPHGVTNERLDEVSDYYRYRPQKGELWPTSEAKAYALIDGGEVTKIVVTDPGSGYCSPPQVMLPGFLSIKLKATLKLDKDLKSNGGIATVEVAGQ